MQHMAEVKNCYAGAPAYKAGRSGEVAVRFDIAPSGEVARVRLAGEPFDGEVADCIGRKICGWPFPAAKARTTVKVFPFVFKGQPTDADRASPYLAQAPISLPGTPAITIRQVAASLFVHESRDAHGVPSNGLVVVLEHGLLLVDTAWTDEETGRILDWGGKTLGRQWIGAVITHEHADRDGGIGTLLARRIPTSALDLTVAKLERRGVHGISTLFAAGARAGSRPFQDPRGFEAFFPGPGHAPDNIVLWFPREKVLFGGCLVKSAEAKDLGFTGDADLVAWPDAARRVAARYQPALVVPGHGPVGSGDAPLRHTLDLLALRPAR
jgi:glyoxylase-like metal-dependent hydrolase (beta-lactamase superfamily II)